MDRVEVGNETSSMDLHLENLTLLRLEMGATGLQTEALLVLVEE